LARKLARKRSKLQSKIDTFLAKTPTALSGFLAQEQSPIPSHNPLHLDKDYNHDSSETEGEEEDGDEEDDDEEDDDEEDDDDDEEEEEDEDENDDEEDADNEVIAKDQIKSHTGTHGVAESILLPLPSHLRLNNHKDQTVAALSEDELIIRQTQASESLEHLRLALGMKAAIFRKNVAPAKSQSKKTRAWRAVHVATAAVHQHARSYRLAQNALVQLNANPSILTKFPRLQNSDLKVSSDVVEENRLGQRNDHVTWIWRLDIGKDQDTDGWMNESE
jgi:hypothetical protein